MIFTLSLREIRNGIVTFCYDVNIFRCSIGIICVVVHLLVKFYLLRRMLYVNINQLIFRRIMLTIAFLFTIELKFLSLLNNLFDIR